MSPNARLSVLSIVGVVLLTVHIAGDVAYGLDRGGPNMLVGVLILGVLLVGAVGLPGRLSGEIIMLLGALCAMLMPVIHTRGAGLTRVATLDGGLLFTAIVLGLGAVGLTAFVLAIQVLAARRRTSSRR